MSATFKAAERMFDRDTETLAFIAGDDVPAEAASRLVGESDWVKRRAVHDPSEPSNYRTDPATLPKPAARKAAAKKTTAKKAAAKRR